MIDGYIFPTERLSNELHEIDDSVIDILIVQNEQDKILCSEITQKTFSGKFEPQNRHDWMMDILKDSQREGCIMNYPYGTVVRQAERSHYYRGEKQIYTKSVSTLHRSLAVKDFDTDIKRQLYKLIADMRVHQFGSLLFNFSHVQNWQNDYGDVLIEPIAQHYGFETRWLDITNDFLTAMFFATCYDNNGKWKPLTDEQIKENPYGIIFHIPAWSVNLKQMAEIFPNNAPNNAIWPIGFQPFMRCHMQHGYGINMIKEFPLQEDVQFEKLKFKHSKHLSEKIFEMTNEGKTIIPNEGIDAISDIIAQIRSTSIFSEEDFEYAFNKDEHFTDRNRCRELLQRSNILGQKLKIIKNYKTEITRDQIQLIDAIYKDFDITKHYGVQPGMRLVYYPKSE